jgi:hypothetical protein
LERKKPIRNNGDVRMNIPISTKQNIIILVMIIFIVLFLGLKATSKMKSPNGGGRCEISLCGVPIGESSSNYSSNPNFLEKCIYYKPIDFLVLLEYYKYHILILIFLIGIGVLFMTLKK